MKQLRKTRTKGNMPYSVWARLNYEKEVLELEEREALSHVETAMAYQKRFFQEPDLTDENRAACQEVADAHNRLFQVQRLKGEVEGAIMRGVSSRLRQQSIVLAPGVVFGRLLGLFMTRKAYRLYVYPAMAEMQAEYFEELTAGRIWRARWVSLRGQLYLIPGWLYGLAAQAIVKMFST